MNSVYPYNPRYPYNPYSDCVECGIGYGAHLSSCSFGSSPAANTKDTNPKDVIGAKKAKLSVVPSSVLLDVGLAMLEGASKYGRHNYRVAGVRSSVYYDAAMGHVMDWWEGQDIDPDSGLSHVTKAIASLVVLRDAMFQGKLTDDRPPRALVHKSDFNAKAAAIIDQHADKAPRHYTITDGEELPE